MIKRLVDISVSLFGLLATSPILLPVMFLIWKEDKKSPFYIASRTGKNGSIFKMVKLRSMMVDADKTGVDSTSSNDMRITIIGHKIRKYKLDELIQLWNVLKGDMSLVGPRPNVKTETDLYTNVEKELLSIRPGISGLWQVSGRNNLTYKKRISLDLIYVNQYNFRMDLIILIRTFGVILFPLDRGAY